MTLQHALLYAFVPALLGAFGAYALLLPAKRKAALDAEASARAMVLLAMPGTPLLLAFIGAFLAQDAADDLRLPLLALGAGCFVSLLAMGALGSRGMRDVADANLFGRTLIPLAVAEVPAILAFLWVFLQAPTSAA